MVRQVQQYITIQLCEAADALDAEVEHMTAFLGLLYEANERARLISHCLFYNDAVNQVPGSGFLRVGCLGWLGV
jgi:hypothetical protein